MSIAHGQRVVEAGERLASARAAMILLHGRGATAEDIVSIAAEVQLPGWAYLAPQAAGSTWYPNPFTAPLESNEPYLSALRETEQDDALRGNPRLNTPSQPRHRV